MEIVHTVVVVDVEDGHPVSQRYQIIPDVLAEQDGVSHVEAEAEVIAAGFLVQCVDQLRLILCGAELALLNSVGTGGEQILQADLHALVFFDDGDQLPVQIPVVFPFFFLRCAAGGMNHDGGALYVLADSEALVHRHTDVFVHFLVSAEIGREGSVHLGDDHAGLLGGFLQGGEVGENLLDGLIEEGFLQPFLVQLGRAQIVIDIEIHRVKAAALDELKGGQGIFPIVPKVGLHTDFQHSFVPRLFMIVFVQFHWPYGDPAGTDTVPRRAKIPREVPGRNYSTRR